MDVSKRIEEEMMIRGWSIYKLSKVSKVNESVIRKWYQVHPTHPSSKNIEKIAKGFGMSPEKLVGKGNQNEETQQVVSLYLALSPADRKNVIELMKSLANPNVR